MAILGQNTDYTDADFDSLRIRLFNLIQSVFPDWTEQNVANFGNILIELYAFVGDVLCTYQNNQALESRWTLTTQRKNLVALAKLIGYTPSGATASQVDLNISINSVAPADVDYPAGSIFRTSDIVNPVTFRLLNDETITAGQLSITATAENSEPHEEIFDSTEKPDQKITLTATPFLDDSEEIVADNGTYEKVDSFLDSASTDLHYTVSVNQNDKATITFGNGISGAIPVGAIAINYKTGGGTAGQVDANTVTIVQGSYSDNLGNPVITSVNNPSPSTPAVDRENIAQIKVAAPNSIKVVNRTVAREDFEINANKLSSVARSLMLTSDQDPSIDENTGFLFVIPEGGGLPTQQIKDDVLAQVTETFPSTLTFQVNVVDPLYFPVDVAATIYFTPGSNPETVKNSIITNLTNYFAIKNSDGTINENVGFGYDFVEEVGASTGALPLSDIYNVVRDTIGVRKISSIPNDFTLNEVHADVEFLLKEFVTLGEVTIINGDTGSQV